LLATVFGAPLGATILGAALAATILGAALAALGFGAASTALAQEPARPQPETRVDVIAARATAIHAGVGLSVPLGRYARAEVVGAAGSLLGADRASFSARGDVVTRWMLDPDFGSRWTAYAAGGASARYDEPRDWRGLLIVLFGAEGPRWRGTVPFAEVGYGGGFRAGVGLRRAMAGRR
jgi:hypothetical protein